MAMEQQFRIIGPVAWGQGSTAATLTATQDWAHANFAGNGGVLTVPFFTAARIRGLAIAVTAPIATTAPIFTTNVMKTITATGGATARAVNATATTLLTAIAGDIYYHWFNDDDVHVNPGEQVTVLCSTAAGATSAGYVGLIVSDFLVGPTSGGTVTVPVQRNKPYAASTGKIYITSSTSSGN
jgi:hypothetical protein